ncbi:MAG TPA: glycoside hydrolase family 97 N-terminal domain-containing protein, partial [Puia sp.]
MHFFLVRTARQVCYFSFLQVLFFHPSILGQPPSFGVRAEISSPGGAIHTSIYQKEIAAHTRALYYQVSYKGRPVILESRMGIRLDNHLSEQAMALKVDTHKDWCENLAWQGEEAHGVDSSWRPPYGERSVIRDHYNATVIHLVKDDNPIYRMDIEVRVYDGGVAFRYFFPENEKGTYYRVMREDTEFRLPQGTRAWFTGWAQGGYELLPLKSWPQESERPLTLEVPNGPCLSLTEARMVDYARTKFTLSPARPNTILTSLYTPVDLISPVGSPWRVIMIGDEPGELLMNNDIIQDLNDPSRVNDMGWIRPGKIMRVMKQTTEQAKATIDFAVQHHLQYILFDWKWYGPAFSAKSDATKVAIHDLDMPEVIRYGNEKGIGVWLYVNQQAVLAQSDSLFRIYHAWGVKGIKLGFVQVGSHRWTTWLEEMFRKAAENKLMLDVHDDWRPTGEQRTWPNLLTAEGIRGNEEMPDATNNTILPFTRGIAGAADYTFCYYDPRIKTTHAHQLALPVIIYSPLQTMYWYDVATEVVNKRSPELEFWDQMPTTWDESKVLQARP